ncbi:MAG TPA: aldo/keto reductase [Acidimicrobiales bacterium]|nr:aldo/keto reductase [Acidimicrobiales bacterium]
MGNSGLKVSRPCLGAMMFGTADDAPCGEAEARRIIDTFLDAGNNFIDTANIYTGGQSEEVVGRAVKGRRDAVVVATKGRGPIGPGPNDQGLSRVYLTRALHDSLRRLDTDYVDLYQCHFPDPGTPIEETMAVLDNFVRAGKVRYIGCSNFSGSQIVEAQWAATRLAGTPFVSLQPRYSLVAREIEVDILPACQRQGVGTLVYSPLGGGVLTGKYRAGEPPPPDSRAGRVRPNNRINWASSMLTDRNLLIAGEVAKVAAELGTTPTAVAIAWVLGRRGVTSVIIGPRTFAQYEENMAGFELTLDQEVVHRLNEVSRPVA